MSYSQNGEEESLLEIFKNTPEANLLDIGAWTGREFSNSLALIEKGWRGTLIEPSPTAFTALRGLHKSNPKIRLVNAAVALDPHLMKFYDSPDAVSTTEEGNRKKWESQTKFTEHWIMPVTPAQLSSSLNEWWDFITIDTEGTSADIFLAMLNAGSSPEAWCVEHDGRIVEISNAAREKMYKSVYVDGNNIILSK